MCARTHYGIPRPARGVVSVFIDITTTSLKVDATVTYPVHTVSSSVRESIVDLRLITDIRLPDFFLILQQSMISIPRPMML